MVARKREGSGERDAGDQVRSCGESSRMTATDVGNQTLEVFLDHSISGDRLRVPSRACLLLMDHAFRFVRLRVISSGQGTAHTDEINRAKTFQSFFSAIDRLIHRRPRHGLRTRGTRLTPRRRRYLRPWGPVPADLASENSCKNAVPGVQFAGIVLRVRRGHRWFSLRRGSRAAGFRECGTRHVHSDQ